LGLEQASFDEAHLAGMRQKPILMERPILIHDGRAAIGRPMENLTALLED
jgi:arsenate reductase (glutaredoxin)